MTQEHTMNTQLHPAFSRILAAFEQAPVQAAQIKAKTYVSLLKSHQWTYANDPDPLERSAGASVLALLHALQPEVDADAEVWNFYAQVGYQIDTSKQ
jgi:hypothetical protein